MTGLEISALLIGMISGNLGAVIFPPLNIGLFWNTVWGALGAAILLFVDTQFSVVPDLWYAIFLASAGAGMAGMVLAGIVTEMRYRL